MAITNQLKVTFNNELIDKIYDFFVVTTSEKYIPGGAYIIDKPIEKLKAESVVFDNGRSLFIMFKKGVISTISLVEMLEDEKITIKKITSSEIKDYYLFRLFLYSLNNFECDNLKFNNVTGKLIIVDPAWIKNNRKGFKALSINVDSEMHIIAEAVGFTNFTLFKGNKKIKDYPKYTFADKNNALRRTLHPEQEQEAFVRKSVNGKKVEIPFFTFASNDIKENKVYFIYKVLDIVKNRYKDLLFVEFKKVNILESIGAYRDSDFIDKAFKDFETRETNLINAVLESEFADEFEDLVATFKKRIQSNVVISHRVEKLKNNIIYIHNKDYYESNKYDDPYASFNRAMVIQCLTVEDSVDKIIKDNESIFNTIIKESVIKHDIVCKHTFSLDDWSEFGFKKSWIFGKEKDGKHYFIIVHPDGIFEFRTKLDDFSSFNDCVLDYCSELLNNYEGKEKVIIADDLGNINIISRTNKTILPSQELFNMSTISRNKESREKYLSGVIDVNLFDFGDGNLFYNSGIKGSGMNTAIPKAPLLYKTEVIVGKNIIFDILKTMSVSFVKYKAFTVLPYPIKYLNEYILMNT